MEGTGTSVSPDEEMDVLAQLSMLQERYVFLFHNIYEFSFKVSSLSSLLN